MITLYGIPNCDTVKKARRWLDENDVEYHFHNFKKDGLKIELIENWFTDIGWEQLLNKRGTTWRKLDDGIKNNISESSAKKVMLNNTSVIKRPVLDTGKHKLVGFNVTTYEDLFK